jgi:hypothetical protein
MLVFTFLLFWFLQEAWFKNAESHVLLQLLIEMRVRLFGTEDARYPRAGVSWLIRLIV